MSTRNDQWFEPGEKVIMVSDTIEDGIQYDEASSPEIGPTYCVSNFWTDPDGDNWIQLVGFKYEPASAYFYEQGELARDFRKVEEIKLCVEAVRKVKQLDTEIQKV